MIRATGGIAAAQAMAALASFGALALAIAGLEPAQLGVGLAATNVGLMLAMVMSLGISPWTTRALASGRERAEILQLRRLQYLLAGLLMSAALASLLYSFTVAAVLCLASAQTLRGIHYSVALGNRMYRKVAIATILDRCLFLGAVGVSVVFLSADSGLILPVATSIGVLASVFFYRASLGSAKFSSNMVTLAGMRSALPSLRHFGFSEALAALRQLDLVMIGILGSATQAGLYGAAMRFYAPLGIVGAAATSVALPAAAQRAGGEMPVNRSAVLGGHLGVLGVTASLAVVGSIVAPRLNAEYQDIRPVILALAPGVALAAVTGPLMAWGQGLGNERAMARALAASTFALAMLLPLSAAKGGAVGAAWAYGVASLIGYVLSMRSLGSQTRQATA